MHVYGAYVPKRAMQLHKPKSGLHVLGFAKSVDVLADYRVLLSPLRFGAGVKGKIVDAWWCVCGRVRHRPLRSASIQRSCKKAARAAGERMAREKEIEGRREISHGIRIDGGSLPSQRVCVACVVLR